MNTSLKVPILAALLASCGSSAVSPAAAQATSPNWTLGEVLAQAREHNPRVRAAHARAEAAAHRAPEASVLPDPTLQLGMMNFGLPDFDTGMPNSMAPSVQLMQMVPFPGKLGLKGDIADRTAEIAEAGADDAWWDVREMAASLFYDLYALDRRLDVERETLGLLRDFQQVAKAMYVSGEGRQADVLRADVEVARTDGELRKMEATRVAVAARLNALIGRPAEMPAPTPVLGDVPMTLPAADTLRAWAETNRPMLAAGRTGVERARKTRELAGREIWPDLTVGVAYGQRAGTMGTERMGSAMLGITLPIHPGRRQYAMRDEAAAMERMARADLDGMRAEVDARIGELLAEADRTRTLGALYRGEVIPEARAAVESAFSSYRVGQVDFMTLVDAQMALNGYEGELHQLVADHAKAVAAIESAIGRTLPRDGALLAEGR